MTSTSGCKRVHHRSLIEAHLGAIGRRVSTAEASTPAAALRWTASKPTAGAQVPARVAADGARSCRDLRVGRTHSSGCRRTRRVGRPETYAPAVDGGAPDVEALMALARQVSTLSWRSVRRGRAIPARHLR